MSKKITDYKALSGFETKDFPTFIKEYNEDEGVVSHFVAIFGNIDDGNDVIMPGAFRKTIAERGRRVKVLDQHNTDSVLRVVGRPLALREVGRSELTPEVLHFAPDASGGLLATTKYALGTDNGRNVFELIKGNYLPETSIGYDAIEVGYDKRKMPDGKEKTVRLLKELRLWEYSNVIWGMNPATATVSAKEKEDGMNDKDKAASEAKPYDVFEEDGEYCVYKIDEDGNKTGDTLGCYPSGEEAGAQIATIEANEDKGADEADEDTGDQLPPEPNEATVEPEETDGKMMGMGEPKQVGNCLQSAVYAVVTYHLSEYLEAGLITSTELSAISNNANNAINEIIAGLPEELVKREIVADDYYGYMELSQLLDIKAGRVISKRNAGRLRKILQELQDIFNEAGLDAVEGDELSIDDGVISGDEDDKNKSTNVSPGTQAETEAGPTSESPTTFNPLDEEHELFKLKLGG